MPQVATRHFGVIGCQNDAELFFPGGVPAFEDAKRFIIVEQRAAPPLVFLQSLDRPDLCFPALPLLALAPDYALAIGAEDLRLLGLDEGRQPHIGAEVACFVIVSAPENRPPTVNLLAPVVINLQKRYAVQAIRSDSEYSHQYPLDAGARSC